MIFTFVNSFWHERKSTDDQTFIWAIMTIKCAPIIIPSKYRVLFPACHHINQFKERFCCSINILKFRIEFDISPFANRNKFQRTENLGFLCPISFACFDRLQIQIETIINSGIESKIQITNDFIHIIPNSRLFHFI